MSNILPQSPIGKVIAYTLTRCKKLQNYIDHREVEIDNILIETSIRPLALGRKNFLFAGSHSLSRISGNLHREQQRSIPCLQLARLIISIPMNG